MRELSARLPARERSAHEERLVASIDRGLLQSSHPTKAPAAGHPSRGRKAMLPKAPRRPFPDSLAQSVVELRLAERAGKECENLRRRAHERLAQNHIREP